MLHLVGDDSVAQRVSSWHLPSWWRKVGIGILAVILVAVIVIPAFNAVTDLFSRSSQTTSEQAGQGVQIGPAPVVNPPAQNTEPEVVAPATPVVVDYQVVWTEVKDFDPSTIPVEEGFYDGRGDYSSEDYAYAWKILPQTKGLPALVSAVRDQVNGTVILVSIRADSNFPVILLSVDGEQSWYKLTRLPYGVVGDATQVRILDQGKQIRLYGKDPRPGNHWWTTTVSKSELP